MSRFCGHFADYNLQQFQLSLSPPCCVNIRRAALSAHVSTLNVATSHWWKFDYTSCVYVREEPGTAHVDDGDPVTVHANPVSLAYER